MRLRHTTHVTGGWTTQRCLPLPCCCVFCPVANRVHAVAPWADATEPPGVPRHIRADDVMTTSAILRWDPPANAVGALAPTAFHVVCLEVDAEPGPNGRVTRKATAEAGTGRGPAGGGKGKGAGSNHSCKLPADAREHRFRGLTPGATYVLAVRACNHSGWGRRGAVKVPIPGSCGDMLISGYFLVACWSLGWWFGGLVVVALLLQLVVG